MFSQVMTHRESNKVQVISKHSMCRLTSQSVKCMLQTCSGRAHMGAKNKKQVVITLHVLANISTEMKNPSWSLEWGRNPPLVAERAAGPGQLELTRCVPQWNRRAAPGRITHQTFDSAHSRFPHSWLILRAFLSETRVVVTNPTDEFSMLTRLTCCKMKKIKINVKNGHIFTPGFSLGLLKRHSRAAWHLWTLFYSTIYLQFTALSTCLLWDIIKQRDE